MTKLATRLIHTGAEPDKESAAIAPAIHLSTTFEHAADGTRLGGHEYQRESNPTQSRLELLLAQSEGGEAALATASGMAAVSCLFQALPRDTHVLIPTQVYHGVRALAADFFAQWGLTYDAVNMSDLAAVQSNVRQSTGLIWLETPSNPQLTISDICAIAQLAKNNNALLAVDNTFATPVLQQPLALGADVVMHSTTKYFGGHSDVMGGALIFAQRAELYERCEKVRRYAGAIASPFNSWLILRGARSLACRVQQHCRNAGAVAEFLSNHKEVSVTHYPGLITHAGHDIAKQQMSDFGGMLSFEVADGRAAALRVAAALKVFTNATSLGGCESLVEHRLSVEGPQSTTPAGLLRLSVGLEAAEDLIADLAQALTQA